MTASNILFNNFFWQRLNVFPCHLRYQFATVKNDTKSFRTKLQFLIMNFFWRGWGAYSVSLVPLSEPLRFFGIAFLFSSIMSASFMPQLTVHILFAR